MTTSSTQTAHLLDLRAPRSRLLLALRAGLPQHHHGVDNVLAIDLLDDVTLRHHRFETLRLVRKEISDLIRAVEQLGVSRAVDFVVRMV